MGGLGGIRFPKFPTVFPKIPKNGGLTFGVKKLVEKLFGEKFCFYNKSFLMFKEHIMFYEFFCISHPEVGALEKPFYTFSAKPNRVIVQSWKFQIWHIEHRITHVSTEFHVNPSVRLSVALFRKKITFFSKCVFLKMKRPTLFKFPW